MKLQLKNLREMMGYQKREDFAEAFGATARQVKAWELGERKLSLEQACEIADFFKCSLDELAGRTEYIGRFSDTRQAELNEIYGYLDDQNKDAALGSMRGIAASQAEKKAQGEGLEPRGERTA